MDLKIATLDLKEIKPQEGYNSYGIFLELRQMMDIREQELKLN